MKNKVIWIIGIIIVLLGLGTFISLRVHANNQRSTAKVVQASALRGSQGIVVKGRVKALTKKKPRVIKISNNGSYVYMNLSSKGTFYVNVSMAISIKAKTVEVVAGHYVTEHHHKKFAKMSPTKKIRVVSVKGN